MGDSAMTVVAIFLAAILMFVFPLMTMGDKKDDVSKLAVQTATEEFVNKISTTGKITQDDYDRFITTLASTGNTFNVDINVQVLDDNPAKKTTNVSVTIGDNVYYVMYTTQVLDSIKNNGDVLNLKKGDIVSVNVENTNITIGEQLRNFFYRVTGNNSITIAGSASKLVATDGN